MELEAGKPTIKPFPNFNVEEDCKALRSAMKGIGTDEEAIIRVLSKRCASQRQQIKTMYKTMFGKDLIGDLKSELSGHFEDAIVQMMEEPAICDAKALKEAISGAGTDESVLTEIICTRSGPKILKIKEAYKTLYKSDLEKDVAGDTSGYYRRVLISCLQGNRAKFTPEQVNLIRTQGPKMVVDQELAKRDAEELFQAGENKLGTDESTFLQILSTRNQFQLAATFKFYEKVAGKDIITSIKSEFSGNVESALKAIVMAQIDRPMYYAERLHKSMAGLGTKDTTLVRVIVTRSEIDLKDVKERFGRQYGKSLEDFIVGDVSGDYRKLLLSICEGNY